MLQRRKRQRFNSREEPQYRSASYLKHVRGFVCAVSGSREHVCEGRIEAAHVRMGTDGGLGVKPSDFYTVPLCTKAHANQHSLGEQTFWKHHGVDPLKLADRLWKASKHYREYMQGK